MVCMEKRDIKTSVNSGSKSYILATSEYLGTKELKHLFRSELRGDDSVTLFLMGVPNPVIIYSLLPDISNANVTDFLLKSITDSIAEFLEENEWVEGSTYYGELMSDGRFHVGSERPRWEDGHWGQLMDA